MSSANGGNTVPIRSVLALALINATVARAGRILLVLYALALGAQPLTVGLLAATSSAIALLLVLPAGKLADRFGARWLLVIGCLGIGIGLLIAFAFPGLSAIFIATAMIGMSFSICNVPLQNLVGLLSTTERRTRDFSNYSLVMSLSNFAGPLVAGFSIDHAGYAIACLYLVLVSLVPLAMLATWGRKLPRGTQKKARAKGGVRTMLATPGVYRTLTTSSLLHAGQDLFQTYLPVYAHGIGLSASAIGIVLAMNSAAAFVVRIFLPRLIDRFKEERVLAYAFGMGAIALILIPLFQGAAVLAVIAFVFGIGMGCGQPIVTMQMFSNSAEGRSGEALGLRMTVNHFTKIVGPVAFGAVGSAFGLFTVFWLNALMLGAGSVMSRKPPGREFVSEEPKNRK